MFPTVLLQFVRNNKQSGFAIFQCRTHKKKQRGHVVLPKIVKRWEDCGPNTLGFQGSGFASTEAKTSTHANSRNCEK
jgi:hypothetical protein